MKKPLLKGIALGILMAGALAPLKADAMNIGVGSKDAQLGGSLHHKLVLSRQLRQQGHGERDIMKATGWYKGVDLKERCRLDDNINDISINFLKGLPVGPTEYTIGDIYRNANFLRNYPEVGRFPIIIGEGKGHSGYFSDAFDSRAWDIYGNAIVSAHDASRVREGRIIIDPAYLAGNDVFIKQILIHEIQHAISAYEDFTRGGSALDYHDFKNRYREYLDVDKMLSSGPAYDDNPYIIENYFAILIQKVFQGRTSKCEDIQAYCPNIYPLARSLCMGEYGPKAKTSFSRAFVLASLNSKYVVNLQKELGKYGLNLDYNTVAQELKNMQQITLSAKRKEYLGYLSIAGEVESNATVDAMSLPAEKRDEYVFDRVTNPNVLVSTAGTTGCHTVTYNAFAYYERNKYMSRMSEDGSISISMLAPDGKRVILGVWNKAGNPKMQFGGPKITYEAARKIMLGIPIIKKHNNSQSYGQDD